MTLVEMMWLVDIAVSRKMPNFVLRKTRHAMMFISAMLGMVNMLRYVGGTAVIQNIITATKLVVTVVLHSLVMSNYETEVHRDSLQVICLTVLKDCLRKSGKVISENERFHPLVQVQLDAGVH